jgi:hypothetical protein
LRKKTGHGLLEAMPLKEAELAQLKGDVNTGSQCEAFEGVNCLACWIEDIQQSLVCSDFKLFTGFAVNVR